MGGVGHRFGSEIPKQFHSLQGKALYLHTLEIFLNCPFLDEILLVCHPDWIPEVTQNVPSHILVIEAGKTRQESSYLGLQGFKKKPDIVLIHDAVRPFLSQEILLRNIETAIRWGAADTCISSSDTLVYAPNQTDIEKIPRREDFFRGQTPQTFIYEWILKAHQKALHQGITQSSDDCSLLLAAGYPLKIVAGDERNFKITTSLDLQIAESLLQPTTT